MVVLQRIVIKMQMKGKKCRSNALAIAAAAPGVISVALEGKERDQVVVTGEDVDAAALTSKLRKKVGDAKLEIVEEVKEKLPEVTGTNPADGGSEPVNSSASFD
ncbi:hypothetical protein U1Q18_000314 [Sarracenia purpurea var. burkii]